MAIHTYTVAINPAFLQEIKDDDRDLRRLLTHTLGALEPVRMERVSLRSVVDLLARLRDQLAMHFTLEEAFGYFDDPMEAAPRLLERAEVLRSEHAPLFLDICQLVERAEELMDGRATAQRLKRLAADFRSFYARFQKHEESENALILEAFDDDIGVGD